MTDLHPEFSYAARLRHRTGTHTGVTGNDDFTYVARSLVTSPADSGDVPLDSAFMPAYDELLLQYHLLLSLCWFSQNSRDNEGDSHRRTHTRDVTK